MRLDEKTIETLVEKVCDMTTDHVEAGGIPFGALVADHQGAVIATGFNCVRENHDPTAHAEIVACRQAAHRLGQTSLGGTTLIASGEPCAMCYMVARYAGIGRIVFALSRHDAARAGFDYRRSYGLLAVDPLDWRDISVEHLQTTRAWEPFERFLARGER